MSDPYTAWPLTFAKKHTRRVKWGLKTETYRYDLDIDPEEGDLLVCQEPDGTVFAVRTVKKVWEATVAGTNRRASWVEGHRDYDSLMQFLRELREYYPDENIGPETMLTGIAFVKQDGGLGE